MRTASEAARILKRTRRQIYRYIEAGLALRLGHRISLDLDLFSENRLLNQADRQTLKKSLEASGKMEILEEKEGTCHLRLETTTVSLFHYPRKLLKPPSTWSGLKIASIEDISAIN